MISHLTPRAISVIQVNLWDKRKAQRKLALHFLELQDESLNDGQDCYSDLFALPGLMSRRSRKVLPATDLSPASPPRWPWPGLLPPALEVGQLFVYYLSQCGPGLVKQQQ